MFRTVGARVECAGCGCILWANSPTERKVAKITNKRIKQLRAIEQKNQLTFAFLGKGRSGYLLGVPPAKPDQKEEGR